MWDQNLLSNNISKGKEEEEEGRTRHNQDQWGGQMSSEPALPRQQILGRVFFVDPRYSRHICLVP